LSSATDMRGGAVLRMDRPGGAALAINGSAAFGWFGAALAVITGGPAGRRRLLVGAPFERAPANGSQAVGAVHGFDLVGGAGPTAVAAVPAFAVHGCEPLAEFGHRVLAANGTVAVGVPGGGAGSRRTGTVYLFAAPTLGALRGNCSVRDVAFRARINGTEPYARLGWDLAIAGSRLAVGAPFGGGHGAFGALGKERGAIFVWNVTLPTGDVEAGPASAWSTPGTREYGRFGTAVALDGAALLVGSPRAAPVGVTEREAVGVVDVFLP